ncbi:hypothetical protein APHAL10511_004539 [Amanita phalloides]|nr:hypothetical protein APHAL10511_004539 [Amanita phalloides]
MAKTLSAIALVTSSAKGNSLAFWWPPSPSSSPRLCRARPPDYSWPSYLDNSWRASHSHGDTTDASDNGPAYDISDDYWQRPSKGHHSSDHDHHHHTSSRMNSPAKSIPFGIEHPVASEQYDILFGYSSEYLGNLLCPRPPMCHQKYELIVDELAFLGHPVCADLDGVWRFQSEKNARGRNSMNSHSPREYDITSSTSPDRPLQMERLSYCDSTWLRTFHLVFILDLPEPSSSASGNVLRYFDIIYEQIAFVITAVLFQEQVQSNFVEAECDVLGTLKESCISKGEQFSNYAAKAIEQSSIARAMRTLYEAIKSSSIAYITLHEIPLELQLPPYLDQLSCHQEEDDSIQSPDDDEMSNWGQEMGHGWRLPSLMPWKSLLLLRGQELLESYLQFNGAQLLPQDRPVAESLIRFIRTINITLSLTDIASLLDWDLETHIYPSVRWLVQRRWAKVVDVVHPGLKTIFALPPKFSQPLPLLMADFENQFPQPSVPSLPNILAAISKSDSHFFASVVKSKELIPMYYDIVHWMLERDLIITLHLRIRLVATRELKTRVRHRRQEALMRKSGWTKKGYGTDSQRLEELDLDTTYMIAQPTSSFPWLSLSPKSGKRYISPRRLSSTENRREPTTLEIENRLRGRFRDQVFFDDEDEDGCSSLDGGDSGWESSEDSLVPTVIEDPGRATPLQRRWLSVMSEGKDPQIAKRFAVLNQYFDGKRTDDEILYSAEISRKQLREVLHHYDEYVQTFLHPS